MLVPWLAVFDLRMLLGRFREPFDIGSVEARCDDFAILVPIFNDVTYLKNTNFLARYREKVVLCTTSEESADFYETLDWLSREFGFRVAVVELGAPKVVTQKNPWAILSKSVIGHDGVLRGAVRGLQEEFVIFLDGDTTVSGDLSMACGAMLEEGHELASVRVLPSRRETTIEKLQGIEYDLAMDGRRVYPWLTSGAGMIARTSSMAHILQNHSLFLNGGQTVGLSDPEQNETPAVGNTAGVSLFGLPPGDLLRWARRLCSGESNPAEPPHARAALLPIVGGVVTRC